MSRVQYFRAHVGQTSLSPLGLEVSRAEGIYIYDTTGKSFADMSSGICVSSLGHNHPVVTQAIHAQVDRYLHTQVYGEHVQAPQVELAKTLLRVLPSSMDMVYFTNSGSEATEGAIKLARKYTHRPHVYACTTGYHGSTIAAMTLMSEPRYKRAYMPGIPGVHYLPYDDVDALDVLDRQTAGVFVEPVRGPAGVRWPGPNYLRALRERCNEVGALLIVDEIQCGLGRTGTMMAFEQFGFEPDIILLAKALGGGMPIGALVAPRAMMMTFADQPALGYISTFGGHPVCCAAGLAALNYLIDHPTIIDEVEPKGQKLAQICDTPGVVIRQRGLMLAIDMGEAKKVESCIKDCHSQGVLLDRFLFDDKAFRIAPPLIITDEEIETYGEIISDTIKRHI